MKPILDPRNGDIEDDASSTKRRTLISLAGSMLAEISLPKLAVTWMLLVGFPGLLLGASPLLVSLWLDSVSSHMGNILTETAPALLLLPLLAALGWFGGRRLLRLVESSFWSLNALGVQPVYLAFREGLRHLTERMLASEATDARRAAARAITSAAAGIALFALGLGVIGLVWPATRWIVGMTDLMSPARWMPMTLANALVLVFSYFALAALIWGWADAMMPQPRTLSAFATLATDDRTWRVAHLSDIHAVGERYGFRVESGRSGPRGNERIQRMLGRLDEIHAARPLDIVLITGDLTDAGRSGEWAEFFDALSAHPLLAEHVIALPGNHDLNVVDRASPARLELPMSPTKRLRQARMMSALGTLQGDRLHVVDTTTGVPGLTLANALLPHADDMVAFSNTGSLRLTRTIATVWDTIFPLLLPPETEDGLGIVVLNSNAETHFSFTNALGLVATDQARALDRAIARYPRACWIVALHHHVIEYPQKATALSERIGTALVNGSWFVRKLQRVAGRAVVMHGHRHVDWIGECGRLLIVSAPSPVMNATDDDDTYFYIHTIAAGSDSRLRLLEPERIVVPSAGVAMASNALRENPSGAAPAEVAITPALRNVTLSQ